MLWEKKKNKSWSFLFFSLHLAVNVPFNTSSKHSVTSAVCPFYALHDFLPLLSFFLFILAFLRLCNSPVVSQEQKRNEFLNELIILHGKVSKTNLAVLWLWLKGKCTLKTECMWTWVHSQTLFNMDLNFFWSLEQKNAEMNKMYILFNKQDLQISDGVWAQPWHVSFPQNPLLCFCWTAEKS